MKRFIVIIIFFVALSSCSEYQKAIKSKDNTVKYELGKKMYEKGKLNKAIVLFGGLGSSYRVKPEGALMYYMYADSYYKKKQYLLAAYQYGVLVSAFPKSDKVEESEFMIAKCHYNQSGKYSLDQKDTDKAIEKLQKFIDDYPDSGYLPESNKMMAELTLKLEKKRFEIAKQYNTTSNYKASIKALDIFMADNPGSNYREESLFLRLDSGYKLAMNSVEDKKKERLTNAVKYHKALLKFNQDTKYKKEADNMLSDLEKQLKQYTN